MPTRKKYRLHPVTGLPIFFLDTSPRAMLFVVLSVVIIGYVLKSLVFWKHERIYGVYSQPGEYLLFVYRRKSYLASN